MKVMQWNFFNSNDKQTGVKRYEDEIYKYTSNIVDVERIGRKTKNWLSYINTFKSNDADIVHATFQTLSPLKILKRPKNFVLTVLDIIPTTQFTTIQKLKHMWHLSEKCINYADKIIAISEFTKQELINHLNIDKDKIHVVYLGIDTDTYYPMNKLCCKLKFNFSRNKKHILIVSSNEPWKNMKLANEIINELGDTYQFVKIGYGDKLNNPKVINLGYVSEENMPILYNACDLFLHTSLYEGFGFPILEAMACGIPIISSDSSSLPEVVKNAGYLLDPNDKDEFVSIIKFVLENKQMIEGLSILGIRNAKTFSWQKTAKETIEVYKTLL
jgi:glycosyltransferase involved in cell wall biosynthesis